MLKYFCNGFGRKHQRERKKKQMEMKSMNKQYNQEGKLYKKTNERNSL